MFKASEQEVEVGGVRSHHSYEGHHIVPCSLWDYGHSHHRGSQKFTEGHRGSRRVTEGHGGSQKVTVRCSAIKLEWMSEAREEK